jgi:hypothetical protein
MDSKESIPGLLKSLQILALVNTRKIFFFISYMLCWNSSKVPPAFNVLTIDYYLTFCRYQCDSKHSYHGKPYARVDLDPMTESTLSPCQ